LTDGVRKVKLFWRFYKGWGLADEKKIHKKQYNMYHKYLHTCTSKNQRICDEYKLHIKRNPNAFLIVTV